jgi:hypothetical protein
MRISSPLTSHSIECDVHGNILAEGAGYSHDLLYLIECESTRYIHRSGVESGGCYVEK